MKVSDIMARTAVSCPAEANLGQAVERTATATFCLSLMAEER